MKKYILWISLAVFLIILSVGVAYIFALRSSSTDINGFFSSLLLNLSASLLVGIFLILVEYKRKVNVKALVETSNRLHEIGARISYFDPSYNVQDEYIGYYPDPYYEYYYKFDMYIREIKNNIDLYNTFFIEDFSLDEKNEKQIKVMLRQTNTKNENYYKTILKESNILIEELKKRKNVFENVTECIEKELLDDPNFLYASDSDYSKVNGYDIDRKLFEKVEKITNSLSNAISTPIHKIISNNTSKVNKYE